LLLGRQMPGLVRGWRFVEDDLYDIASRVIEYDQDARLIRNDESGVLGLARWVQSELFATGGYWFFVREIHDLSTDEPLTGEPDARVIQWMHASDNRRIHNWAEWNRASDRAEQRRKDAEDHEMDDEHGDIAERFMNVMKKDVSARPRAFIPDREKAVA
jgi:hypothetical protein